MGNVTRMRQHWDARELKLCVEHDCEAIVLAEVERCPRCTSSAFIPMTMVVESAGTDNPYIRDWRESHELENIR